MKKIITKKFPCLFLAVVIVTSFIPLTVIKSEAYSQYELYCEIPGGSSAVSYLDTVNGADIWINGGKATYSTGTVSETKSIQLQLYEKVYENGAYSYYNINSVKGIEWYVGTSPAVADQTSGKLQNKNEFISVSKGKVTAGKTPGTAYVFAYRAAADKTLSPTLLTVAKINIKFAPQKIAVYDKITVSSDAVVIKDVSLKLAESKWIYPAPEIGGKNTTDSLLNSSELTYNISIDKNAENISVSTCYRTAKPGESIYDITANELALGIIITAHSIIPDTKVTETSSDDRQDKPAKANIVITNRQSGKSIKIPVTVNNTVYSFTVPDETLYVYTSKNKQADSITLSLNPILSGVFLNPQYYGSCTEKPQIGIYTTDQTENFINFTDSKGKLKLPTANKSSEVTVSVKNKANTKLELKFKKADYTEPKTVYIVVAYGTGENQIKQFSLVLFTPSNPVV